MVLRLATVLLCSLLPLLTALKCINGSYHIQQPMPLEMDSVDCNEGMCMKTATFTPGDEFLHFSRACVPVVMDTEIGCETNFALQHLEPKLISCFCDTDWCNF
ncbi:unnamed protein product, partial [Mesorhabditis spiculigera]